MACLAVAAWPQGPVLAQAATLPPFSGPDRPYYRYAGELEHALELSMQAAPTADGGDDAAAAYVQGVADAVQGSVACPTPAQRSGELIRVVQAYFAANPGCAHSLRLPWCAMRCAGPTLPRASNRRP